MSVGQGPRVAPIELRDTTAVLANERSLDRMPEAFRLAFKKTTPKDRHQELWRDMVTSPSSKNGQWEAWLLVKRGDETTQDTPISYSGWLKRPCLVRTPDGQITEQTYRAWVPVFTPDEYQGNAYAKHLMRLLHYIVAPAGALATFPADTWGPPPPAMRDTSREQRVIGTLLSSIVPPQVYEGVTVRSASGSENGFVFPTKGCGASDLLVYPVSSSANPSTHDSSEQHGDWGLAWIRQSEMDDYTPSIRRAAEEAIRHPAEQDQGKTIVHPLPVPGQVWHLDYLFRVVIPQDRPLIPGDTISGFRLFRRSHQDVRAEASVLPHEIGSPLCLFFEEPDGLDVLHQSGFVDEELAKIFLSTIKQLTLEKGLKHVRMLNLPVTAPVRTAALSCGGEEVHLRSFPPDPMPPVGHYSYVDGDVVWRGIEYYNFP